MENFTYCPQCFEEENVKSQIKRIQLEQNSYWVTCTREDCFYLEEFSGKAVVSEEDLTEYGLPAELLQHMVIYSEDINKIVRTCMSENLKIKLTNLRSLMDLKEAKDLAIKSAECHGIEYPCESQNASQPARDCNVCDAIQKIVEDLVEDIPLSYQEEIKTAFSKIEGYNFPEQFEKDSAPDKLLFLKNLEEEEKENRLKDG